jgi:hypothetical protein
MKYLTTALVFSLCLFGCEDHDHGDHAETGENEHADHAAQHGGEISILGDHAAHLEVIHDDEAGTVTVWIFDGDMKPAEPDAAPVFNFVTEEGPQSLEATKKEGAWVFSGEALKGEPQKARFLLKVGGKSYSPDFAHKH